VGKSTEKQTKDVTRETRTVAKSTKESNRRMKLTQSTRTEAETFSSSGGLF